MARETLWEQFGPERAQAQGLEVLRDNGPEYASHRFRTCLEGLGLVPCRTPCRSLESNRLAEAFLGSLKRERRVAALRRNAGRPRAAATRVASGRQRGRAPQRPGEVISGSVVQNQWRQTTGSRLSKIKRCSTLIISSLYAIANLVSSLGISFRQGKQYVFSSRSLHDRSSQLGCWISTRILEMGHY